MDAAMPNICPMAVTFLGQFTVIFLVLGALLHLLNFLLSKKKPKARKKSSLWIGGTACLLLAVLSFMAYLVTPPVYTLLYFRGNALGADGYDPCNPSDYIPYCGDEYCSGAGNKTIEKCTCLRD